MRKLAPYENFLLQSILDYPNPFGQLQKSKRSDKQKVRIIESIFDVLLTMPTPIDYSVPYSGKLSGRKLSRIGDSDHFVEKTFMEYYNLT